MCELSARLAGWPDSVASTPTIEWIGYSRTAAIMWMLGGAMLVMLAATLRTGENRSVYVPFIASPIPESCATYRLWAVDCPGCGLTRTFIHLAHGRFGAGLELNTVGLLVFLFTLVQIPLGFGQGICGWRGRLLQRWPVWNERAMVVLLTALCLQWLARFLAEELL